MTSTLDTETRTGPRVTPTARLITKADATRDEWLTARRDGITATDVVKIVGESRYGSAFDVYLDKTSFVVDEVTEAGEWGQYLEAVIADRWAELNGLKVRRVGLLAHVTDGWMRASLDRLVSDCPDSDDGRCGVEIKTRNAFVLDDWQTSVPESVNVQVQWQLAVTGLDHMHVAALIGGQRLIAHTITPDPVLIDWLKAQAELVWHAVVTQTPPVIDPAMVTVGLLNRMHPDRSGAAVVDGQRARQLLAEYADTADGAKAFDETQRAIKTELIAMLGDAEDAVDENGTRLYSYRAQGRRTVDWKRLEADFPDAYAACVSDATSRVFRPVSVKAGA